MAARLDAYGAREWREGESGSPDEYAYRTEKISRSVCRAVAEFAFQHAQTNRAKVFGGPKFTVSPVYEGMFKEELDAAAARYPGVRYEPQLIDATFALLLATTGEAMVIPSLNRDGDLLSDLVLQMFGSIAGSESMVISLNHEHVIDCVMAEAPHGTAPSLQGKNIANPMAMILAAAGLLGFMREIELKTASRAIYDAALAIATPVVATTAAAWWQSGSLNAFAAFFMLAGAFFAALGVNLLIEYHDRVRALEPQVQAALQFISGKPVSRGADLLLGQIQSLAGWRARGQARCAR